ncbi:hypothetical protein MTP99_001740 [Tenebrio molitor]|nr:hypothetical protein MTP99_001740 [Tenebrio molitor]
MITLPSGVGRMSSLLPFTEFRIYCRLTTGVVERYQPDEETSQEILVLADSSMLTRSLPADTVKPWSPLLRPDLAGPDEILIRKAFGPETFRSELLDPLGDLGRWYLDEFSPTTLVNFTTTSRTNNTANSCELPLFVPVPSPPLCADFSAEARSSSLLCRSSLFPRPAEVARSQSCWVVLGVWRLW